MAAPVVLVEATPRRATDGTPVTVRLAGGGASTPYHYGGEHWRGGIDGLPKSTAALDFDGEQLGGGGVAQAIELTWASSSRAALAEMSALYWTDAPIVVRVGPEGEAMPPVVSEGLVLETRVEGGALKIALADQAADLKRALLVDRFAGTGGAEGPPEFDGQIKPRAWGRCFNVPGKQIDAATNIWCFGDPRRPWAAFDQVRDRGVAAAAATLTTLAWQGSVDATFAALQAAPAIEGGGVLCPSIECVKWWTAPAGDLHADIRGETIGGYVETAAEIAARIVAARSTLSFAPGAVAEAATSRPAPFGWRVSTDSATAAAEISDLLGGVSLSWLLVDGAITFRRWDWTASTCIARSFAVTRKSTVKPVSSRKLGYRRNQAPMARGDLAAIVLVRDVVYEDGLPIADAIEQAGTTADWDGVTGGAKPEDYATNGANPASPLGPDGTIADALALLAEARQNATEGLEQIAAAKTDLDATMVTVAATVAQARQTVQAALSGQLLEQRRRARFDALTHLDGVRVGTVVREEATQRVEGELATAATFTLIGAKNSTGTAFILDGATVLVSADQSLAERFETIDVTFEGVATDAAASISSLETAISNETEARATEITNLETNFTTAIGTAVEASVTTFTEAISNESEARATAITDLDTSFQGALTDANAAIVMVQEAISNETEARATEITNLETTFTTAIGTAVEASVTTFTEAISDETEARATAITDLETTFTTAIDTTVAAAVTSFGEAISDEAGARADQYDTVTARLDGVGGGEASVEQLFSTQADILGNLSARASLAVTAGGVWSGIFVTAEDGSEEPVSDITLEAMTINVSTAKLIFNNGSVMKVLGTGFGIGAEFIEWFGPSMDFDDCTRANAISYETNDGDAHHGGTLSAGVVDAPQITYGATGECSLFYDVNGISFSTTSWVTVATLALTPTQGQPIHGVFSCVLTNVTSTSTQAACRIIRDDGTALWGGSAGLKIAARDEGESLNATFFDSVNAGRATTYSVQMRKQTGTNVVRADFRSFILREMTREHFQSVTLSAAAGEGPGRGAGGGGSINGGGFGLQSFYNEV